MDAFSRGLIRSQTDYIVFEKGIKGQFWKPFNNIYVNFVLVGEKDDLSGLDIAFYKNRALYHTLFDSISGMGHGEAQRSLWVMLDTVRGVGTSLLNEHYADDGGDRGVYFDCKSSIHRKVVGPLIDVPCSVWFRYCCSPSNCCLHYQYCITSSGTYFCDSPASLGPGSV